LRYAVLADVHANLEALEAVLAAIAEEGVDRIVCAGDLVGYHADPEACVALLREAGAVCIAGNHDRVAAGVAEPTRFGTVARDAIAWTRAHLSPESRAFLASLPLHRVVDQRFLMFHGSLHPTPNADLHLSRDARVARSIQALREGSFSVTLAFFGHTHRAVAHEARGAGFRSREVPAVELDGEAYLINPGSVGQPRDGDPRAAYAIYDAERRLVRFRRVPFDREATMAKAANAGLLAPSGRLARLRAALGLDGRRSPRRLS
jgi:predicted phosphodiesterase